MENSGKKRVIWKESVQKLKEKRRQERKRLAGLSAKFSEKEEYGQTGSLTNINQEKMQNYERQTENMPSSTNSIKKPPFKEGFIDCDVDTIVAEDQNTSRSVRGKYRRSQSNRDISLATFRFDNANRRQSFQVSSESSPRSLFGAHGGHGGQTVSKDQWRHDFDTTNRAEHTRPAQAWAKSKRPRLTSRISSLI